MSETLLADIKIFRDFVSSNNWIFAKTYAKTSPHWYVVKEDCDQKLFEWAIIFIRKNGKVEYYQGYHYTCFRYEGYKYWTMGDPVKLTQVINRAKL